MSRLFDNDAVQRISTLTQCPLVARYILNIPSCLHGPLNLKNMTVEEIYSFEFVLSEFPTQERERDQVITLQNTYQLPLHPNQSLKECTKFARLKEWQIKRKMERSYKNLDDLT